MRSAASGASPSPVSSTRTSTSLVAPLDEHGDRAVGRRVPQRVREQVEEHALDLVGRAPSADGLAVEVGDEVDAARRRLRLEQPQADSTRAETRRLRAARA